MQLVIPDAKQVQQVMAKRKLIWFTQYTKPDYLTGWFSKEVCEALDQFLEDVIAKKSPRLMLFSPRRHGKSELVSRRFPAYALGKHPDLDIIAASYGATLASELCRDVQRIIDSPEYVSVFPDTKLVGPGSRAANAVRTSDAFDIVGHKGSYFCAGVGGGATGRGSNCFPAGTLITTDCGEVPIEEIVRATSPCKVLSYSKEARLEWKRAENWSSSTASGLRRITTSSGRVVVATSEHPFFTGDGYTPACDLASGDSLLLIVQSELCKEQLRGSEASEAQTCGQLLLCPMFDGASCREELEKMPGVRRVDTEEGCGLLPEAQTSPEKVARAQSNLPTAACKLPDVQHRFQSSVAGNPCRICKVLFKDLCAAWALQTDVWRGQSEVERRCHALSKAAALCESISCYTPADLEAGQSCLCSLQEDRRATGGASCRQQSNEQCGDKLGDVVLPLPSFVACSERFQTVQDTVALVEELSDETCVYDIRVADNHNFFANGILVHNCMILDDPFKDAAEAYSETVRRTTWEWFQHVFYTCCEPGAGILIVNTRWHPDDIAGKLLQNMARGGEQWKVLSFPAIAEVDEPHRKIGEALCPERYDLEALNRIRTGTEDEKGMGSRMWAAMYQQRPSEKSGEAFKRENWQFMCFTRDLDSMGSHERRNYLKSLGITKIIQTWDTAIGGKAKNDFAACTTMGVSKNKYIALEVWQKQIAYPEMRRAVQTQYDKWLPDAVGIEGGGAAAGKAVIQDLKAETRIPFHEIITSKDKELRADLLSPTHEAGLCYLPEGAAWVADFIDHCAAFPAVKHDDDVDSWMLALEFAESAPKAMHISDETLAAFGVA